MRSRVHSQIEDAKILARAKRIAVDHVPIFRAVDFITLGGRNYEYILVGEALFIPISIVGFFG
jgi:hypothetical protein